jgi:hypothetical protein
MVASSGEIQERTLEIEPLLINRPRATYPERLETRLEFKESSNMLAKMSIKTQHVALKEKIVPIRLLSPIVVAFLLPQFTRFSAERQEPIIVAPSKPNIFERVPEIFAKGGVGEKAPVFVLAQ